MRMHGYLGSYVPHFVSAALRACFTQAKQAKQAAKDAAGSVSGKAKETGAWAHDKTRDVVDSVASGTALQVLVACQRLSNAT